MAAFALSPCVSAATPSASMLANTCAGCHGTDGVSIGPATPTIAGMSTEYFVDMMEAYKADEIPSTVMGRIAKGYTKEEIEVLAEHFAKLPFVRPDQQVDEAAANQGAKLHRKFCEKCHEDGGRSSEDDAGILAGQWTPYLRWSMDDFTSDKREMTKKMRKKVTKMLEDHGDEGIEQLLQFYASQK
ncbi:MAG: sulfide dehydrogenase [Gammaproteobacteria bacterium SG8_47]|nr:MAG: sulfide dehydrogenase [Gammaproteobacteria bacterium SG8_47]